MIEILLTIILLLLAMQLVGGFIYGIILVIINWKRL